MVNKILSDVKHRPYDMPNTAWSYYQEWNHAVFVHYEVPMELLRGLVPQRLHIDSYEGKCYISVVAFTMQNIRPAYFPAISLVSDFHEINVRTYVDSDGKKGVYFLNIEAEKELSAFVARSLSKLPYEKAVIRRGDYHYQSKNSAKKFELDVKYKVLDEIASKTPLDLWLTERYCLYLNEGASLYRYDIHHAEWVLNKIDIQELNLKYKFGGIDLIPQPYQAAHYSPGVKVVAWGKQRVG